MATTFQNIEEPHEVALHICRWIIQRITHTGLSGKMHDAVEFFPLEQLTQYICVCDVGLDKAKAGLFAQFAQAVFLQSHIVISIEIIQAYYFIAARKQPLGHVHADESRGTRYKYFHYFGAFRIMYQLMF